MEPILYGGMENNMNIEEYLRQIEEVNEKGTYHANWQSLSGHKTPEWYYKGKFGIFIHWGLYSVPAFATEWYSRQMYNPGTREYEHHIQTYGPQKEFGYKDFIPMFRAEKFDPNKWAKLFKDAGAKFVMPVCEHHDGFAMYDTEFNRWNAKNMGPKRNVVGELKQSVEKEGMVFCASTHRAEHYFFMNTGRTIDSDVNDEEYRDFYGPAFLCDDFDGNNIFDRTQDVYATGPSKEWMEDWMVRTCELIDRYQPRILYFDWWIHHKDFKPYLQQICAYYYNRALEWGVEVTIDYKHEAFPPSVATFDVERGALEGISPVPWQTDTAIGNFSWGYTKDNEFKSPRRVIEDLVDIVSKNGMLLLNVGPKADGTITDEETNVLMEIGKWLKVNGEGIYDTIPWKKYGEGSVTVEGGYFTDHLDKSFTNEDFRFTYNNGYLYAFQMRPSGKAVNIKSLAKKGSHDFLIESVTVLGEYDVKNVNRTEDYLEIELDRDTSGELPICFKIEIG